MTEYLTEQEQIELLKNWIKQYSFVILAGVVIALVTITGWRYWQDRQTRILDSASILYDDMLLKRSQNDMKATVPQAQTLAKTYSKTVYGQMAALQLAQASVNQQHYAAAEANLQLVLDKSRVASIRQIARLRLARVLIAENKPSDALKTLATIEDKTFNGLTNEIKGDAYLALKNIPEARQAYANALQDLPNAEVNRPMLQMKYDNLTSTVSAP